MVGAVGRRPADRSASNASSKSFAHERPHLLRLAVVGVVVAGGERIGAEQDAPLHLGPEAFDRETGDTCRSASRRPRLAGRSESRRSGRGSSSPPRWRSGSTWRWRRPYAAARRSRRWRRATRGARSLPGSKSRPRAACLRESTRAALRSVRRRAHGRASSRSEAVSTGADVASRGSCPASASSRIAASRTSRVKGPTWSSDEA